MCLQKAFRFCRQCLCVCSTRLRWGDWVGMLGWRSGSPGTAWWDVVGGATSWRCCSFLDWRSSDKRTSECLVFFNSLIKDVERNGPSYLKTIRKNKAYWASKVMLEIWEWRHHFWCAKMLKSLRWKLSLKGAFADLEKNWLDRTRKNRRGNHRESDWNWGAEQGDWIL